MRKAIAPIIVVLLAGACGCQNNAQTDYQQQRHVPIQANMTVPVGGGGTDPAKEQVTSSSNNNGGAILTAMGGAFVAPFKAFGNWMDYASGHTPGKAAREMEDANPDRRRAGIADLVISWDFARKPPYTTRYKQIAQSDPDYTVRAMAVRALNISRDKTATKIFIAALEDESELVRLEGAKALANVPDPDAVPALLRRLQGRRDTTVDGRPLSADEGKDVRIAAADALRNYHTLDVARTLVSYLNERDFSVAWQSRQSLVALTGRDLSYSQAAWLQYLSGPEKPFS